MKETFKYEKGDPGPFRVLFKEVNGRKKFIEEALVGQKLAIRGYKDVELVERASNKIVTATFKNYTSANKVVEDTQLKTEYNAFIIKSFVLVDGYIKIDPDSVEWNGDFGIIDQLKKENENIKIFTL